MITPTANVLSPTLNQSAENTPPPESRNSTSTYQNRPKEARMASRDRNTPRQGRKRPKTTMARNAAAHATGASHASPTPEFAIVPD